MKNCYLLLALIGLSSAIAGDRIVVARGFNFGEVQSLLNDGWTVRAQSSLHEYSSYSGPGGIVHIFTLAEPSPELMEKLNAKKREEEAKKKAEFEKRRAEYLEKKNSNKATKEGQP